MKSRRLGFAFVPLITVVASVVGALTLGACSRVPDAPKVVVSRPAEGDRAARVAAIERQYRDAHERWIATYAGLDDEDAARFARLHPPPRIKAWIGLLWELVDERVDDAAALDALRIVVTRQARGADYERALALTLEHHVESPAVAELVRRLDLSASEAAERLLEAVLAKNPDRATRGEACLALGVGRLEFAELLERTPKFEDVESYIADLAWITDPDEHFEAVARARRAAATDLDALRAAAIAVLQRAVDEFDDVPYFDETVGEKARAALTNALELVPGRVAPEIVGEDVDGRPMKLSDFRGKVVLLDF